MKYPAIATLILSCTLLSCTSSTKELSIFTSVPDAKIQINGKEIEGRTPLTTEVDQHTDISIIATKPGYEAANATLETSTSFWWGLIWTQRDPRAQYLDQDVVELDLVPIPALKNYIPKPLPRFAPPHAAPHSAHRSAPGLREMPDGL